VADVDADVVAVEAIVVVSVLVAVEETVDTRVYDPELVAVLDAVVVIVVLGDVISHDSNAPVWYFVIISLI
jgi:hypothetical protein